MELSYWQSRWRKGNTGFHMNQVYPGLTRHWSQISSGEDQTVLVPLCGKSLDMIWLSQQTSKVVGVEISEIAVKSFFEEHELSVNITKNGPFLLFQSGNITIWCGDFFHIPNHEMSDVTIVYDKASMVALPLNKRERYRDKIFDLTHSSIPILLHHFHYDQTEMNGPPFSITPNEIEDHYGAAFKIKQLEKNPLNPDDYKKFKNRGLKSFFIEYLSLLLPIV